MKNKSDHDAVILAQSSFGVIQICWCGCYHVHLRNINLRVTRQEFGALVDLFKRAEEKEEKDRL